MNYLLVCLLPLLSVISAAPHSDSKRFIVPGLDVGSLFDFTQLKCDVQIILDVVGSDPTEAACEAECHNLIQEGKLINFGCPLICHALQNLAHYFHETPKPGDQNAACGGLDMTTTSS